MRRAGVATEPAQDLLTADRPAKPRDHVTGRDTPLGKPAHARTDGFDGYAQPLERIRQIGRRTRPGAQVARIAKDAGDGHAIEAQRVTDVEFEATFIASMKHRPSSARLVINL